MRNFLSQKYSLAGVESIPSNAEETGRKADYENTSLGWSQYMLVGRSHLTTVYKYRKRIVSPIIDADPNEIKIGDEVELKVVSASHNRVLFFFKPKKQ